MIELFEAKNGAACPPQTWPFKSRKEKNMPELETENLVFRPYLPSDRHFIESSWASSYYAASRIKDLLSPDDFHAFHRPLRARFFERPTAAVIVCASPDDSDHILGWVAVEVLPNTAVLHYVYVKSTYRRDYGIAGQLLQRALPPGPVLYTHFTPRAAQIMSTHRAQFGDYRFCPHLT